jgi:hypothetical protein
MKFIVITFIAILFAQQALADDTVNLLCAFEHGTLEITINYTRETANDRPAMISDKEIVWSPDEDRNFFAIINRYTGVMQMSNRQKEFTGMCRKTTGSGE